MADFTLRIRAVTTGVERASRAVRRQLDGVGRSATKAASGLSKINAGFSRLQGIITGGAVGAALGIAVKRSAEFGDEINNLSRSANLGARELQVWQRALTDAGATQAQAGVSLVKLNTAIQAAGQGSAREADAFRTLGVELGNTEQVLRQLLADTNPSNINERLPALRALFGDEQVKAWASALQSGTDDFDELLKRTSTLSGTDAASLAILNSQFEELGRTIKVRLAEEVVAAARAFGLLKGAAEDAYDTLGTAATESRIRELREEAQGLRDDLIRNRAVDDAGIRGGSPDQEIVIRERLVKISEELDIANARLEQSKVEDKLSAEAAAALRAAEAQERHAKALEAVTREILGLPSESGVKRFNLLIEAFDGLDPDGRAEAVKRYIAALRELGRQGANVAPIIARVTLENIDQFIERGLALPADTPPALAERGLRQTRLPGPPDEASETLVRVADIASNALGDLAADFVFAGGEARDFGLAMRSLIASIAGQVSSDLAGSALSALIPGLPAKRHGGPVFAGQPVIVGEVGPEIFVPPMSGRILPNGKAPAGGGDTFIYNDPNILEQAVARLKNELAPWMDSKLNRMRQMARPM